MSVHLDKVIKDANSQISGLQNKISSLTTDQKNLQRKNEEIAAVIKEKNKRLLRTQELYDKLKRRTMLGQIQEAASDVVRTNIDVANATGTTLTKQFSRPGVYNQHQSVQRQYLGTPLQSNLAREGDGILGISLGGGLNVAGTGEISRGSEWQEHVTRSQCVLLNLPLDIFVTMLMKEHLKS
jgi:hypothetical protein